jgi:uncharacterized repeat protein (TIGR03837 family)
MPQPRRRWDIFGKVVDNFGDAGVGWRLARELAAEHGLEVTLWQDDLATLARIAPDLDPMLDLQTAGGVTVRRWREPFPEVEPADVVVEAFGCGLPASYTASMRRAALPPAWFVLEYLSAEPWVGDAHGLASPHPQLGLRRRFWFPGFTAKTGGLIREHGLFAARDAFRRDEAAQRVLWSTIGVPAPSKNEIRVTLFCYPNAVLPALLDAWADGDDTIVCIVPEGVATGALDAWSGGNVPHSGCPLRRGHLSLHSVPFVSQDDYDRLLWASSINFVRGEDSFVRAQWAASPFVWHIYPQAEGAHWPKLDAFIGRYTAGPDPHAAASLRRFWHAWNDADGAVPITVAWQELMAARSAVERHSQAWAARLAALPELGTGLVKAALAWYD